MSGARTFALDLSKRQRNLRAADGHASGPWIGDAADGERDDEGYDEGGDKECADQVDLAELLSHCEVAVEWSGRRVVAGKKEDKDDGGENALDCTRYQSNSEQEEG